MGHTPQERFRMQVQHMFDKRIDEGLEELDRELTLETRNILHWKTKPRIALAYLHEEHFFKGGRFYRHMEGFDYSHAVGDFIGQLRNGRDREDTFKNAISKLPRQSGLAKRKSSQFTHGVETLIPMERDHRNSIYNRALPVISLVTIGANENYPHNIKGNSKRAVRDVAYIGAEVVRAGVCMGVLPFWASSDIVFGKDGASKKETRMEPSGFLSSLNRYRGFNKA
ncbi:hypothetical protein CMI41_04320 [Candidatus Pacearchaeota archaeon]|nr:hypothetical protein [Candidatus Pacearchaeota archaeon]|tara:strand:+ start:1057 stop:1731 length:675 start_codon:yes stop_codon:yes gene_type:complete